MPVICIIGIAATLGGMALFWGGVAVVGGIVVVGGVALAGVGTSAALSLGTLLTTSVAGTGAVIAMPPTISAVMVGWLTTMAGLCDPSFKWLGAMRDMFFVVGGA